MHNLRPYITNCIDNYDTIIKSKHDPRKTRLIALRNAIDNRYNLYQTNFLPQNLHNILAHAFSDEEKEDLLNCYSSPTIPFFELVTSIKENQDFHLQGTCQYCGINSDSTVDHYLPEGNYPDYCIYPLNLIPCCPDCNSNKGIFFYNTVLNTREIVNLYLDQLPNIQFLFVNVTYRGEVPRCQFQIDNRNAIDVNLYRLIDRHFFRLKLCARFKGKFPKEYTIILKSFKGKPLFIGNRTLVTQTLLADADELYLDHGFNYWKRILRISLANNSDFLDIATS